MIQPCLPATSRPLPRAIAGHLRATPTAASHLRVPPAATASSPSLRYYSRSRLVVVLQQLLAVMAAMAAAPVSAAALRNIDRLCMLHRALLLVRQPPLLLQLRLTLIAAAMAATRRRHCRRSPQPAISLTRSLFRSLELSDKLNPSQALLLLYFLILGQIQIYEEILG